MEEGLDLNNLSNGETTQTSTEVSKTVVEDVALPSLELGGEATPNVDEKTILRSFWTIAGSLYPFLYFYGYWHTDGSIYQQRVRLTQRIFMTCVLLASISFSVAVWIRRDLPIFALGEGSTSAPYLIIYLWCIYFFDTNHLDKLIVEVARQTHQVQHIRRAFNLWIIWQIVVSNSIVIVWQTVMFVVLHRYKTLTAEDYLSRGILAFFYFMFTPQATLFFTSFALECSLLKIAVRSLIRGLKHESMSISVARKRYASIDRMVVKSSHVWQVILAVVLAVVSICVVIWIYTAIFTEKKILSGFSLVQFQRF